MRGEGRAFAAISILNGTATGIGCSLAVEGGVEATWESGAGASFHSTPMCDSALVEAVRDLVKDGTAKVETRSFFPPSRGLKTSGSAAAALLRAAHASRGEPIADDALVPLAVEACRRAGVTLTGALDDQEAVVRGGCHLADSPAQQVLDSFRVPPWEVAIWVPDHSIAKAAVRLVSTAAARSEARRLADRLTARTLAATLTANGRLFTALYAKAGLPVSAEPARIALASGALGAGLSGTGPAVAALFEERVELPAVPGGTWAWTRTVAEAP